MKQSALIRVVLAALGGIACISLVCISGRGIMKEWRYDSQEAVLKYTEEMYMPGLAYMKEDPDPTAVQWIKKNAMSWLPLVQYVEQKKPYDSVMEDEETIAKILENQANDENMIDENGNLVGDNALDSQVPSTEQGQSPIDMSIERLRDFDYLISNFYIVDGTTMIGPEQLNVDDLLGRSMKIDQSTGDPKF